MIRSPRGMNRVMAFAFLMGVASTGCGRDARPLADSAELLTIRTVGLAYLEENRLDEAEAEFLRLVEMAPNEPLGYANLGLTYLRLGRLDDAERQVRRAIEVGGGDPQVRLILVEVLRAGERDAEARQAIVASLAIDSTDVRSWYALALLDADSTGSGPAARRASALGRVADLQGGNVAALVELAAAGLAAGDAEAAAITLEGLRQVVPEFPVEGQDLFDAALAAARSGEAALALPSALAFQNVMRTTPSYQQGLIDLRGPGGVLVGFPVVTFSESLGSATRDPETVVTALRFTDATALNGLPPAPDPSASGSSLAVADYDGDGDRDLFAGGRLYRNDPLGFVDVTLDAGVDGPPPTAATFGDYDNDGLLDLYLARPGGGVLLRNGGSGVFVDVSAGLGVPLPAGTGLFVDYDQDGDLDLVVVAPTGDRLLRNDLDGSFTDGSARAGLGAFAAGEGAGVAFGDFDDDDDLDLVVADPAGGLRLFANERLGRMVDATAGRVPVGTRAGAADVGDYNNDGRLDLLVAPADGSGVELLLGDGAGGFAADTRPVALLQAGGAVRVHDARLIDFDNDGWLDVVMVGDARDGPQGAIGLFRNADAGVFDDVSSIAPIGLPPLRRLVASDLGDDGDLDLFVSAADGSVRLLRNDGGNANRYLKMQLVGLSTGSGKNNHFGIGAKIEVRAGALYQSRVVTGPNIHIGLGQHVRADVVRVRWTNGVPQNLFYPGANQSMVEEQILKGSCPFLYTWSGEGFEFVTDLMWKSALGMPVGLMALGEAEFAPPTASREYLRIPGSALVPRDGAYALQITKELWEVSYIDEVKLVAVDHPDSVDVFVDERFVFPRPDESLRLHAVTEPRVPRSAVDHRGRDVLPMLRAADDVYVSDFAPGRYQGLSEMHDLVIDVGAFAADATVKLYLRGWIFPTDASINVALSQSTALASVMPYLEVVDASGSWVTAVGMFSFPAGKNKLVVQDLSGLFPTEDHRVRIRTNMNVYWDHAFFTLGEPDTPVRLTTLEPTVADLHFRGFSRLYRKGGRFGPHWFDYQTVSTESPWRPIQGRYTRYGDVLPLLSASDDRYPILAPGDEMTVTFAVADAPALPDGWTRDFLIYTDGWIKDADLSTALGNQVGPLPFHAMSRYPYGPEERYPHADLLDSYHTREAAPPAPLRAGEPRLGAPSGSR